MGSTRRQKAAGWSFIAGTKGENRVRVYERAGRDRRVAIWIDYRDEDGRRHRTPLRSADRDEAKAKAEEIAAKFRRHGARRPVEPTLAGLIDTYAKEVTPTKGASAQAHDRRAFPLFLRAFGRERRPTTLSRREWDAYIRQRRSGALRPPNAKPRVVGDRIIEQDLKLLNAVLNWATQAGDGAGGYLLDRNPLKGLTIPREESPRRARLTQTQYEALLDAARPDVQLETFLVLAWYTGHRAGSLRRLRWSDVDLEKARIHFRGENDKIGLDHWNPLHADAVAALKRLQAARPAIGDAWMFVAARHPEQAASRYAVQEWWRELATRAGLPAGERYGWHAMRRGFAGRHRRAPLRELMDLGGWKSEATLLRVYLGPDEDAQREVLEQHTPARNTAGA